MAGIGIRAYFDKAKFLKSTHLYINLQVKLYKNFTGPVVTFGWERRPRQLLTTTYENTLCIFQRKIMVP